MPVFRPALLAAVILAGCAAPQPAPQASGGPSPHYEPAPIPSVGAPRRPGMVGALEMPLPPKMPLGTGAVPVGGGVARGSIVTGIGARF